MVRLWGTVADVVEEMTKNRYKGWREELNPMIVFSDGWRLVPNQGIRRTLIDALGPETDAWKGQQLRVFRQKMERTDPKTGGAEGSLGDDRGKSRPVIRGEGALVERRGQSRGHQRHLLNKSEHLSR